MPKTYVDTNPSLNITPIISRVPFCKLDLVYSKFRSYQLLLIVSTVSQHGQDKRAIGLFYFKAAPGLSGSFYGKFWEQALFQIGLQDPALRQAMIALSSIFENECIAGQATKSGSAIDRPFAIESYNLAIRHLLTYLEESSTNILVPLMACILFVCIDFVRHDPMAAMCHIKGGLKLLETFRTRNKQGNTNLIPTSQHGLFGDVLVPIYSWLNMITSIFGGEFFGPECLTTGSTEKVKHQNKPENIDQSISTFVDIVSDFITFAKRSGHTKYSFQRDPAITIENMQILAELD